MDIALKKNELNQLEAGTRLFRKGERTLFIGLIVKGSVRIQGSGISRLAKKGSIIGSADVFFKKYLGDYIVEEDAIFYAFPAMDIHSLENFLINNLDYRGIVVHSVEQEMSDYLDERNYLLDYATDLYQYLNEFYAFAKKQNSLDGIPEEFLEKDPRKLFQLKCGDKKTAFFQECAKVQLDVHKKFYYNSSDMTLYQAGDVAGIIEEILTCSESLLNYIEEAYHLFWDASEENLFDHEVRLAVEMRKSGKFQNKQFIHAKMTKDKIASICELLQKRTVKRILLDKKLIEQKLSLILSTPMGDGSNDEDDVSVLEEDLTKILKGSLQQILKFAKIKDEDKREMEVVMEKFYNEPDRMSTQDDLRKIKKKITTYFFEIYTSCIFQWFENRNVPLAVRLFLNYGFMDERLLEEDQIRFLCEKMFTKYDDLVCPIYTIPEWLKEIYEGKKDPSRNSFEQDYRDWLREEKRNGSITEKQEKEYLEDNHRKVLFEIDSLFVSNNKIVNGKLSTYVPVLYKEEIYGKLDRLYLTKKQLSDAIVELEKLDFTVFYREVLYTNPELKIEKEQVLKHVYPDVIMAPVYGTASSMWQEITGKKRDTPGRFIFPVISENEVSKLVTKAFGRFHWEYCRCEQGVSWNNIQYKSLTSEYMDYIQYYRKNRDLTDEKRKKIKTQILKARNNSREVFLSDYEMWIYNEAKSAMKLNKVSRYILATYCPFNKETREVLKTNATFAEAMMKQQKNFGEKAKEWALRIKKRQNNGLEVPKEFYETYEYYAKK